MTFKQFRHTLLYHVARFGFFLARALPRKFGLWLFGGLGGLIYHIPYRDKIRALDHLRLIFGTAWNEAKIKTTAKSVFVSLGKNLFDAIKLSRASDRYFNSIVKHDDLSGLNDSLARGTGGIIITAHIGCYELLLHFFARHGYQSFAIGRRLFDARLDAMVRSLRSGRNIEYLDRDDSALKVVRNLKAGKLFGVLIDQDTNIEGVFATFLGKQAFTPSIPLKIGMRLKVPVFVVTTARQPDDTHHVFIGNELELTDTGNEEADLLANVQKANDLIGARILQFPEQWVWMHRRWKQQPPLQK